MNPLQWPLWGKAVAVAVVAAAAGLAGTAVALSPGPHRVPVARSAPSSKPQAATSAASPTPASSGLSAGCQMGEGNFSPVTQQNISDDDPSYEVTVVNNTASPVTVNGFSVSMTAYGSQITTDSPTVNPSLMEPGEKWTFNTPITSGVEVSGQTYLNTDCTVTLITTDNGDVQPLQMNEPNGEANTHQQNITDAQNQLQNDLGTLNQDVSGMYGDVSKIAGDVSQTDNDLSQTRTDAANGNGDECLNASTTVYNDAATTVYNDVLTTAYNDAGTVGTDIAAIRKQISTIQADQAALQDLGQSPGGADAISSAQAAISSAISTVNPEITHLNSDLSAAYVVADSVGTGSCAGDGPGSAPEGLSPLK
jgi:hypothetical protein